MGKYYLLMKIKYIYIKQTIILNNKKCLTDKMLEAINKMGPSKQTFSKETKIWKFEGQLLNNFYL